MYSGADIWELKKYLKNKAASIASAAAENFGVAAGGGGGGWAGGGMAFPKEYDAKLLAERQRQRDMQRQHILKSFFISDYMLIYIILTLS
jgi:hypothetical protein